MAAMRRRLRAHADALCSRPATTLAAAASDATLTPDPPLRRFDPPTIDLSRLRGGPAERNALAAELDDAFRTVGFGLLTNFDDLCPADSLRTLRREASSYFLLPEETKREARVDDMMGYLAPFVENVAATVGDTTPPDLVESLNLPGYQEEEGGMGWGTDDAREGCPWMRQPWAASMPTSLQQAALDYWVGQVKLLQTMMELAGLALGLDEQYFASHGGYSQPGCLLRLASYLEAGAEGPQEDQSRYNAHTDYDGFTFLSRAAGQPGLEIQLLDGEWVSVVPPPDCLVVNIGDLLARWSNDRWRATMHRVANAAPAAAAAPASEPTGSGGEPTATPAAAAAAAGGSVDAMGGVDDSALSVVFFSGPHPDTIVACLPSDKCTGGTDPGGRPTVAKYPPVTAAEHVRQKIELAAGIGIADDSSNDK
jgi:isopenicillin N synthase-like dioxygenase